MEPQELWPRLLVPARARLNSWNQDVLDCYGVPMTGAAKAQALRSNALGEFRTLDSTRYELDERYIESGRVLITDSSTGTRFQLKSVAALVFEQLPTTPSLFEDDPLFGATDVDLVLYEFSTKGLLRLECASARFVRARGKRTQVCLAHDPVPWGVFDVTEPIVSEGAFDPGSAESFEFFGQRDDLTESDDR